MISDSIIQILELTPISESVWRKELIGSKWDYVTLSLTEGRFLSIRAGVNGENGYERQFIRMLEVADEEFMLLVLSKLNDCKWLFPQIVIVSKS